MNLDDQPYDRLLIGGMAAFGLFAIIAIAISAGPIRDDATRRSQEILALAGHDWADVDAYGRGMAIVGEAPSAAAGEAAVAAVADDWSVRRAWAAFSVSPPRETEPAAAAMSGPPIDDIGACQGLLDGLMENRSIEFETGEADIKPSAEPLLNDLGAALQRCETMSVDISGHTDATGDAAGNLMLSKARAEAVAAYLIARGVTASHVMATGFGAEKPVADNDTEAGRAKNRRIEFRVVGVGDAK